MLQTPQGASYPAAPPGSLHKGPLKGQTLYELIAPRFHDWKTAAGIAAAESSGDPNSKSPNPDGGENRGLFQIDTKTAAGAGLNPDWLFIPSYNVYAAWVLSKHGTDWRAWATAYGNPKDPSTYLSKDAPFRTAGGSSVGVPNADSAGAFGVFGSGPSNPLDAISNPLDLVKSIWSTLSDPHTWIRVVEVLGGIALLLMGLKALTGGAVDPVGAVRKVVR